MIQKFLLIIVLYDKIANALFDFFIATGIPRNKIFCSSLPGNDVRKKISDEVKEALENSCLNIAILSDAYYKSAYCLNEAGILWFVDTDMIPIALPEIRPENMIGFLNNDYKIRRLDNTNDLTYIYDTACDMVKIDQAKTSIVNVALQKLIDRYQQLLSSHSQLQKLETTAISDITTDDERIVLYYLISKKFVRQKTHCT